ncbi:integration host factor subunit beta [Dissulfurirhabdus thermomarina]|uniref:Integration host factor subunit beta n=1 Tax=Dissulfurirhabdus thermomarina TaxID=1765737 RepID=A0A6N9TSS7_DISTH|nr:HU family DNA-binding protein [Dissulfurirhabdus thermomarina]NDY43133.1 integration host factor subunit beta [Dissulfurirhabdus thermomarina]NMX23572.1 integration host factor subunit beta [Dissulfurirhabdus thermomarina]
MLKGDLVAALHAAFPEHLKKDIEAVVDVVFETMAEALKAGRRIEIRGLGSFCLHPQKGRTFVNPKTGRRTECPPGYRIVFKPGKELRNNGRPG